MTATETKAIKVRELRTYAETLAMESRRLGEKLAPRAAREEPPVCACNDGWVTLGQMVVDTETGEEYEGFATYLCRVCSRSYTDLKEGA